MLRKAVLPNFQSFLRRFDAGMYTSQTRVSGRFSVRAIHEHKMKRRTRIGLRLACTLLSAIWLEAGTPDRTKAIEPALYDDFEGTPTLSQPETAPGISLPPSQAPGGRGTAAYPAVRSTDAAAAARGRDLFINKYGCAACHAQDLRGSDTGTSLLRSVPAMMDVDGEKIGPVVRSDPAHGQAFATLSDDEIRDVAQFIKSVPTIGNNMPISIPAVYHSGDPVAGQRYFAGHCASCHAVGAVAASPAISLANIGAGIEPTGMGARDLQQRWLSPKTKLPVKAVVILPNGERYEGNATSITEFDFSMTLIGGTERHFAREGDIPRIELSFPLAAHAALVRTLTDREIHDVTGYLVTLK
jgi:cytochrome c oxidase cbb3-type subunit III